MQDFGLFISYRIRMKRHRRFHCGQAEQLHHVVGHHIAQGSCIIEVSAPSLHSNRFRIRDLHMVDVAPIPDRLEDGIVETEDHDVLHGLLAQVVIDAVNLVFL